MPSGGDPPQGKKRMDLAEWEQQLRQLVADVETSATEWGIRSDSREGKFVSALLGTTGMLGRLSVTANGAIEAAAREHRDAAASELASAREIRRSAEIALSQARSVQLVTEVERENFVGRMIKEVFPAFLEKLAGALVLREKRWNAGVERRRFGVAGLVAVAVFLTGYATGVWRSWAPDQAMDACAWRHMEVNGRVYCDITSFMDSQHLGQK